MTRTVADPSPEDFEITLPPEKAMFILERAREVDERVVETEPGEGHEAIASLDDELVDEEDMTVTLEEEDANADEDEADATDEELMDAMEGLNEDEQLDLIAIVWVGRGDYTAEEFAAARQSAADMTDKHIPRYLAGTPLLADYLEEGLTALGFDLED